MKHLGDMLMTREPFSEIVMGNTALVRAMVESDTAAVSGLITLDASQTGKIAFLGSTEFKALTARAAAGITVAGNIVTTVGNLNLDGSTNGPNAALYALDITSQFVSAAFR